jgi:two-component system response regulator TctD
MRGASAWPASYWRRVMSKDQLAAQVFGLDEEASADAIEIYIHRLRKKLEGQPVRIVTFRGLGYMLEALDG